MSSALLVGSGMFGTYTETFSVRRGEGLKYKLMLTA